MLRTGQLLVAKEGDLFMQVRRARLLDKAEVFFILIYEANKKTIVIFRKRAVCLRLSLVVSSAFIVLAQFATKEGARLPDCGSSGVLLPRITEKGLHHRLVPETNDALPRHATNVSLASRR
jgi:hypothetical protein